MGRYLRFGAADATGYTFNFATRCDVTYRKEYFMDFVFGGSRADRAFGLTRITPELTAAYDVDALGFLRYVLGNVDGTVTPWTVTVAADPGNIGTIACEVDGEAAGITNAKVDNWELSVEEGAPARANFTAIGRGTYTVSTVTPYTADFSSSVLMPSNFSLTINTSACSFSLFSMRINNALDSIFKTDTLPVTLRPTGLEITGRIRVPQYAGTYVTDGSITLVAGTIGTIYIGNAKVMEIPPRVTGYELPTTEYSYTGFPQTAAGGYAIRAIIGSTVKW